MALNHLGPELVNHLLGFVKKDKTCSRQSRAALIKEVLRVCTIFTNPDQREQCKYTLKQHDKECTEFTVSFSNFRYEENKKRMYFKFDMHVDNPRYMMKLVDFCINLNRQILHRVADKADTDAFSPEQYESTGDFGEELGYGRLSPEHYFDPSKKRSKSKQIVGFTCLMYLTRIKEQYSNFPETQKDHLKGRFTRTRQKIEQNFSEQVIIELAGKFLRYQLCAIPDLEDCSYSIDKNVLHIKGEWRSDPMDVE